MKYTAEEVRDWHLEEVRRLNSYRHPFPNDSTVLAALIMHHQSMADAIAARLTQPAQSVDVKPVAKAWLCDNGASENLMVTLSPRGRDAYAALGRTITPLYTHPAPPIDLAAVREVIESHINEAKNLRHDPELQDYLYEQADKLTAALQEKGNG